MENNKTKDTLAECMQREIDLGKKGDFSRCNDVLMKEKTLDVPDTVKQKGGKHLEGYKRPEDFPKDEKSTQEHRKSKSHWKKLHEYGLKEV